MYYETLFRENLFWITFLLILHIKANSATETWRASKVQNAVDVMMTRTGENLRFDN